MRNKADSVCPLAADSLLVKTDNKQVKPMRCQIVTSIQKEEWVNVVENHR